MNKILIVMSAMIFPLVASASMVLISPSSSTISKNTQNKKYTLKNNEKYRTFVVLKVAELVCDGAEKDDCKSKRELITEDSKKISITPKKLILKPGQSRNFFITSAINSDSDKEFYIWGEDVSTQAVNKSKFDKGGGVSITVATKTRVVQRLKYIAK